MALIDRIKIFVLLALIISSCGDNGNGTSESEQEEQKTEAEKERDSIITGEPVPYSPDIIDQSETVEPKMIMAGNPDIESAYLNVKRVSSPTIKLANPNPETITPGLDGAKTPETVEFKGKRDRTTYAKPIPALSPSFKDAATYNIQYIDVDQGLGSSYIMSIEEDSRGNLWFSTWQMGVSMYNGREFRHFGEPEGLCSNYIWSICEDSEGKIWFGSDGSGLSVYDGDVFMLYDSRSGLPSLVIKDIIRDDKGNMWLATLDSGICKVSGEEMTCYTTDHGLPSNQINDLALGRNGNIIIGTADGLCIYDGVSFTTYKEKDGLHSNDVQSVFQDSEDNIWIGSYGEGVCQFDGYSFFKFTMEQGLSSDYIEDIIEDYYGNIWFASSDGGLSMYDRNNFTHITTAEGLSNNTIYSIHEDTQGNLWFGSYGAGVNKYNEHSFQNFTEDSGLPTSIVRHVMEDRDGHLWFSHTLGASKYVDGMFHHYDSESGLSDDFVRFMHQDFNGNIWFATNGGGITKFDGEYFYHYGEEQGLNGYQVLTIYEDKDSNLYFGTVLEGVYKINNKGQVVEQFNFADPMTNNTVRAINQDAEGNMWFGTNGGGAMKYDGKSMTTYSEKQGIKTPTILSFLRTRSGEFWIGTEHSGAFNYDAEKDTLIPYGIEQGLTNNIVWSMIEDLDGNIWLGTERGLNELSFNDSTGYMITQYGKLDGLKGVDFFPNSVCLDNQTRFWWGSGKALIMLDLTKYEHFSMPPRVTVTDVELHQTFVDYRKLKDTIQAGNEIYLEGEAKYLLNDIEFSSVQPFTNAPVDLELPYDLNHCTFHYSAVDWAAPHKLQYQYKLVPLDEEWSPITNESKAVYNNIPEGSYTFQVRSIGESQQWSEIAEYKILVHPPWYRTVWAYISYVVGGLLLIILVIYWRTRNLIEQRKKLEHTVQERTLEVVQQKELVEMKNKEITDSITYAKRIQEAILPASGNFKQALQDSFILYKPKDIVAGDFYWLEHTPDKILVAAADCTGHGVPGAMVSVVCNNALNRAVREFGLDKPSDILNKVRDLVIEAFDSGEKGIKDGMDIALLAYNKKTGTVEYSGANNSLYCIKNGKLETIDADKQPIGKYAVNKDFTNHIVEVEKGDTLYIYTDGYMDQFGGPRGKKFKYVPFMEMLMKIQDKSMTAQKEFINEVFESWRGDIEQVDDVCVIGIRF